MAWYKTGTVTVTNGDPVVTGVGTFWINAIFSGDSFTLDGEKLYEIASVDAHDQLTLAVPYDEATAPGAAYSVVPTSPLRGSVTTLVAQFSKLVDDYKNIILIANQDRIVRLNKAADAANSGTEFLSENFYRARIGLFGSNDLKISYSADGTNLNWVDVISIDTDDGTLTANAISLTDLTVTNSASIGNDLSVGGDLVVTTLSKLSGDTYISNNGSTTNAIRLFHDGTHGQLRTNAGSLYMGAPGFTGQLELTPIGTVRVNTGCLILANGNTAAAAWGSSGVALRQLSQTYTDISSSGVVATNVINAIGVPTMAASSATTYTDAYNTYFWQPVAGANVTITNCWALGAESIRSAGALSAGGNLTVSGTSSFTGAATFTGAINGSSDVRAGANNQLSWQTRSKVSAPADAKILLTNNAATDFGMLQFGGTSASFPALKRSSAALHVRLADDSGFTYLRSAGLQMNSGSLITDSSDGVVRLMNSPGTDFNRLQFGGTTASFPAIKRSGAELHTKLADDSGFATSRAQNFIAQGNAFYGSSGSFLQVVSDGVWRFANGAGNDFNRLQLGGASSAYPSIKRNGSGIDIRNGDDTAYTNLAAATIYGSGNFILGADLGQIRVNNTAGTGVAVISTVKGWLGSGSNVTDAAVGSIGSTYFYVANANRIAAIFDAGGSVTFNASGLGNVRLKSGLSGDRSESGANLFMQGSGFSSYFWMDSDGFWISQDSNSRSVRVSSGSNAAVGVILTPGATSWSAMSRRASKTDLLPVKDALQRIARHTAAIGRYKVDDDNVRRAFLFREDADEYWPYAAHGDDALSLADYVPLLMQGIKDLSAIVELQDQQISAIQANMGTN